MIWISENGKDIIEGVSETICKELMRKGLIKYKEIVIDTVYFEAYEGTLKYRYSIIDKHDIPYVAFDSLEKAKSKLMEIKRISKENGTYEPLHYKIYDELKQCVVCAS